MRIRIIIVMIIGLLLCSIGYAEKYAVKFDSNNKIISSQQLSDSYIEKFKDDSSNPLNQGYILVDDISKYEEVKPIIKTEKERTLEILGLTDEDMLKIKALK